MRVVIESSRELVSEGAAVALRFLELIDANEERLQSTGATACFSDGNGKEWDAVRTIDGVRVVSRLGRSS